MKRSSKALMDRTGRFFADKARTKPADAEIHSVAWVTGPNGEPELRYWNCGSKRWIDQKELAEMKRRRQSLWAFERRSGFADRRRLREELLLC